MCREYIKRILTFIIFASLVVQSFSYAKSTNPHEMQEFKEPTASEKTLHSDNVIINQNKYHEYNPLNPTPIGIDPEEYKSVDNYNIDLNTLDLRIKYFAPAYLDIKLGAEANLWMSLYVRGGSTISSDTFLNVLNDGNASLAELKSTKQDLNRELTELKREDPTSSRISELRSTINGYNGIINETKKQITDTRKMIQSQETMLKHRETLNKIANVDDNNQVSGARRIVLKQLRNLVLTYLKLNSTMDILKEQMELNKKMYETYLRNYDNGTGTSLEVSTKLNAYESSKKDYNQMYTTFKNLKEQICVNLGYDLSDIDKLNFIEPELDIDYITNIKLDEDRDRAYNSNAAYSGIKMSGKDKKFPGSTGEVIYNNEKNYTASKVIIELEDLYANLQAALWTYNGAGYLEEITKINDEANERKKSNCLVSDVEYFGLKLQNLSYKLQVKNAKYDLIVATDEYYYATMGDLSI